MEDVYKIILDDSNDPSYLSLLFEVNTSRSIGSYNLLNKVMP